MPRQAHAQVLYVAAQVQQDGLADRRSRRASQARAEHAARIAQARAHFDAEVAAMRRELAEALADLSRAQLLCSFAKLTRGETDRLN